MAELERVYADIARLARLHGARRVILFGSRARGTNHPKSDIDIAVEGCADFPAFADDVDERLWTLLSVDIVNLDGLVSPALRESIARDGRPIYEAL